jgi:hypothetical protein
MMSHLEWMGLLLGLLCRGSGLRDVSRLVREAPGDQTGRLHPEIDVGRNRPASIFSKPLETLTPTDVAELCEQAWPEGYQVEFKRSLPNKKGDDGHPWMSGSSDVGDRARDGILSEIVGAERSC